MTDCSLSRKFWFGNESMTATVILDMNNKKDPILGIEFKTGTLIKTSIMLNDINYAEFIDEFRAGEYDQGSNSRTIVTRNVGDEIVITAYVSGGGGDSTCRLCIPPNISTDMIDFLKESIKKGERIVRELA